MRKERVFPGLCSGGDMGYMRYMRRCKEGVLVLEKASQTSPYIVTGVKPSRIAAQGGLCTSSFSFA